MKFTVVLLVFAVCGTFAEPQSNPLKVELNEGSTGKNIASNILGGISEAGASVSGGASASINTEIQITLNLIQCLQQANSNGNIGQSTMSITQLLSKLQQLVEELPANAGAKIKTIIQLLTNAQIAANGGNKAGANSLIVQIVSLLKQAAGADATEGGAAGPPSIRVEKFDRCTYDLIKDVSNSPSKEE